ncbi:MAG TPA: T9SS type A sorting domain-containing protein, partial [Bacteroidia bacterium]
EFSPDNGTTWVDLTDPAYASYVYWNNPYVQPVFTGNSAGWKQYRASISTLGPLFNIQYNDTVLFRFSFISDGVQTFKDGLMFDSIFVWDVPPVGIDNIYSKSGQINAYPNPASAYVSIQFGNDTAEERILKVYNTIGRQVDEMKIAVNANKVSLDINNYPAGIYLYSLDKLGGFVISSGKFIKNK